MDEKNDRTNILKACVAKAQSLKDLIDYSDDSIVSKTIIDKPVGTITLFAFDKEQALSEHTVKYDAMVEVIDGVGKIRIRNEQIDVSTGQVIIMPANIPHAVKAEQKFKMLLTMIRA